MKDVPLERLKELAGSLPEVGPPNSGGQSSTAFDLELWIKKHDLNVAGPNAWQRGSRWIFEICPWNPAHQNRSAFIAQLPNGAISAGCHHNGCRGKGWHDLRDAVEPGWRSKGERQGNVGCATNDAWAPVIPFCQFDLPPFPSGELPEWLRAFVSAVATATQTPDDLAALLALSVVAAACAKKVIVKIKHDHFEPLNIFTVVALPPGNRKSAVFKVATHPLEDVEKHEAKLAAQDIARYQSARKIKEARLKKLEQKAAEAKAGEQEAISTAANELATEIAQMPIRSLPRYIVDDCTPERLATILSEQGGRIAVMSPEGDVFELMAGRYSTNATTVGNLSVYLKGHAGDQLRVDRVGRASDFVDAPAITIGLAVQPEVIRGLTEKPGFRGRGLLARFLYSLPKSPLGHRDTDPPAVPDEVRDTYDRNVLHLLKLPVDVDADGSPAAHMLNLDLDAHERMREFEAWIEPQLAEFGDLGSLSDWAGKLVGAVGRIAGLLHMAAVAGEDAPWLIPIPGETVEHAVEIGKYLIPHAKAAFAEMGADAAQDAAKRILRWIQYKGLDRFTKRDLHQGLKGTFKRAEELDAPLALLETHIFIRKEPEVERTGAGRRPSPTYDVNPLWSSKKAHDLHDPSFEPNSEDYENSEKRQGRPEDPPLRGELGT